MCRWIRRWRVGGNSLVRGCFAFLKSQAATVQSLWVGIHCRFKDNNRKREYVCARSAHTTSRVLLTIRRRWWWRRRRVRALTSEPSSAVEAVVEVVRAAHNSHDSLQHYRSLYINAGGLCHYAAPTEFYTKT